MSVYFDPYFSGVNQVYSNLLAFVALSPQSIVSQLCATVTMTRARQPIVPKNASPVLAYVCVVNVKPSILPELDRLHLVHLKSRAIPQS